MQSTFSKRNTLGRALSARLIKQSNERNRESKGPTVDVRFTEIPFLYKFPLRQSPLYQRQKMGHPNLEKSLHGNKKIISRIMRTPPYDQSLLLSS